MPSFLNTQQQQELQKHMIALADGDRNAFNPVYRVLFSYLTTMAQHLLPAHLQSFAEDAVQNALHKLFEQASNYRREVPVTVWAYQILYWECRTILRKYQRKREVGADPQVQETLQHRENMSVQETLDARLIEQEWQAQVRQFIEIHFQDAKERAYLESYLQEHDSKEQKNAIPATPAERKRKQRWIERLRKLWSAFDET